MVTRFQNTTTQKMLSVTAMDVSTGLLQVDQTVTF